MILSVTLNPSVDRTVFVERMVKGDTNRILRSETDAGGKGINVARVAAELGSDTVATGFIGGDAGTFILNVLKRENVQSDFVEISGDTRLNFIVEDETGGPPTTFNEPGPRISEKDLSALISAVKQHAANASYIAMGGSLPPGVDTSIFKEIMQTVRKPCAVDSDTDALRVALDAHPLLVKPNASEAERLLGISIRSERDAVEAAEDLRRLGAEIAIISMGEKGAAMVSGEGKFAAHTSNVKSVSTIGSGDSLIGGFLHGLEQNFPHDECLKLGAAAGAATAMTNGSEICRKSSVEKMLAATEVRKL